MLNWNEISGIWKQTDSLNALVCDPYHFIGHQQHCLNKGGYLVCDNVPLGFYQCDMKAECDSMMIQSFLPFPSCFPPLSGAGISPPYQNDDTTADFHEGKHQSQQYLCTWSLCTRTAEELCSKKQKKEKKSYRCWWPWKFKCAWFTSPACLLRFFITVINCFWIQLPPGAHLSVHSNLSPRCFSLTAKKINDAQKAVKTSDCPILIIYAVICGFNPSSSSLSPTAGVQLPLLIITPLYIHLSLILSPPCCLSLLDWNFIPVPSHPFFSSISVILKRLSATSQNPTLAGTNANLPQSNEHAPLTFVPSFL